MCVDIEYWIRNLDEHGAPGVFKQLVGNKCDLEHKRKVTTAEAQALADKHNMPYVETSAKENLNVAMCFRRLVEPISKNMVNTGGPASVQIGAKEPRNGPKCCQAS